GAQGPSCTAGPAPTQRWAGVGSRVESRARGCPEADRSPCADRALRTVGSQSVSVRRSGRRGDGLLLSASPALFRTAFRARGSQVNHSAASCLLCRQCDEPRDLSHGGRKKVGQNGVPFVPARGAFGEGRIGVDSARRQRRGGRGSVKERTKGRSAVEGAWRY